jgi:hypothetical protein
MTQVQLAAALGTRALRLSRIENGHHAPDMVTAIELELLSAGSLPVRMWRRVARKRGPAS